MASQTDIGKITHDLGELDGLVRVVRNTANNFRGASDSVARARGAVNQAGATQNEEEQRRLAAASRAEAEASRAEAAAIIANRNLEGLNNPVILRAQEQRSLADASRAQADANIAAAAAIKTGRNLDGLNNQAPIVAGYGVAAHGPAMNAKPPSGKPELSGDEKELVIKLATAKLDPNNKDLMAEANEFAKDRKLLQGDKGIRLNGNFAFILDGTPVNMQFNNAVYTSVDKLANDIACKNKFPIPEPVLAPAPIITPNPTAAITSGAATSSPTAQTGATTSSQTASSSGNAQPKALTQKEINQQAQVYLERLGHTTGAQNTQYFNAHNNDAVADISSHLDGKVGGKTVAAMKAAGFTDFDPSKPITLDMLKILKNKPLVENLLNQQIDSATTTLVASSGPHPPVSLFAKRQEFGTSEPTPHPTLNTSEANLVVALAQAQAAPAQPLPHFEMFNIAAPRFASAGNIGQAGSAGRSA